LNASEKRGRGRALALDLGTKTIGLAVSDPGRRIATSLGVIRRKGIDNDLARIAEIIERRQVAEIIIGLPLHLDGTENQGCKRSREFARIIEARLGIKPVLVDEALTTAEAEQVLIEADLSRKKRKKVVDGLAATFILKFYLDEQAELLARAEKESDGS